MLIVFIVCESSVTPWNPGSSPADVWSASTTQECCSDRYATLLLRIYCMAGNFGGKIFWRIAENMSFGGIYFGG